MIRLRNLVPPLSQSVISSLEAIGIKTTPSLLFAPPHIIFRRLQQHARVEGAQAQATSTSEETGEIDPPLTFAALEQAISQVRMLMAAQCVTGDSDRARELARHDASPAFACGVRPVDYLLDGLHGVIELSGERRAGKTILALQTVLHYLSNTEHSACLWIDTAGTFPADHASTLLACRPVSSGTSTALERLHVSLAFDIEAAHDALETLRSTLDSSTPSTAFRIQFLVIDTVSALISPLLSAVSSQGHASMVTFMRQLHALARTFDLTVLVLNGLTAINAHNTYSSFAATHAKPALGPSFTFMTDATVWLARADNLLLLSDSDHVGSGDEGEPDLAAKDIRILEVFKARDASSRRWCTFRLAEGVLSEA